MQKYTLQYTGDEVNDLLANVLNTSGNDAYILPSVSSNTLIVDLPLTSYKTGSLIRIRAPQTLTSPSININGLGAKTIDGKIYAIGKVEQDKVLVKKVFEVL